MGQRNIMLRIILHELKDHRFFLACPTKIINVLEERVKYWLTETGKKSESYWRENGQGQPGKEFLVLQSTTEHQ